MARAPRRHAPPKPEPMVRLAVRIPKSLHQQLKVYAATTSTPMGEVVTSILSESPIATAGARIKAISDQARATHRATHVRYLSHVPKVVPAGRVLVHNHVQVPAKQRGQPGELLGVNGFRAWLAAPGAEWEACSCNWAPELGTHYRVNAILDARE